MLKQGLYEQVVNTEIKDELRQLPEDSKHIEKIDAHCNCPAGVV